MNSIRGIERKIEKLFNAYKKGLSGKEACINLTVEYVRNKDSVDNSHPSFIRNLCEIAENVIKSSDRLDDYLERLYDFSMTGVRRLKSSNGIGPYHKCQKEEQLLAKAGRFSWKLFEKTKDIGWGAKAYDAEIRSAEISEEFDQGRSIFMYDLVANKAQEIAEAVPEDKERVEWLIKACEALHKLARMSESYNGKQAAYGYNQIGKIAEYMAEIAGDEEKEIFCNNLCSENYFKSSMLVRDGDQYDSALRLGLAADALERNAILTEGDEMREWAGKSQALYNRILSEYDVNSDDRMGKVFRHAREHLELLQLVD